MDTRFISATLERWLQSVVAKAMREGDIAERMNALGMQMQENVTADYQQFLRDDLARYTALVTRLGIQIQE
jgi:tripartite-type tricarboxylate transporter receptor subunit TctC